MEINYPPYKITDKMLNYVSNIMKKVGEANYFEGLNKYPELRRKSRIRSIHSSGEPQEYGKTLFYPIGKRRLPIYQLKA